MIVTRRSKTYSKRRRSMMEQKKKKNDTDNKINNCMAEEEGDMSKTAIINVQKVSVC